MSLQAQTLQSDLEKEIPRFVSENMETWINETILKDVLTFARASNMPKSFIDSIKIESIDGGYAVTNDWKGKNDEPLARFFEYGTTDHWIEPRDPKGVLAWSAVAHSKQRNPSAIYYQNKQTKKGDALFSKGHYVSGLPALEPMNRGLEKGKVRLYRKMKTEIKKKFSMETATHKVRVRI